MVSRSRPLPRLLWVLPGLILITAALTKISHPLGFLYELSNYNFKLSLDFEAGIALLLPVIEIILGLSLLFWGYRWSAFAAIVLFSVFTAAILMGLPQGYLRHCGCLGPENLEPGLAIAKNIALMILLVIGWIGYSKQERQGNPWGALALVLGAVFPTMWVLSSLGLVAGICAFIAGSKHLIYYLIGLLFGIIFHFLKVPLIVIPILAGFYFLLRVNPRAVQIRPVVAICFMVAMINFAQVVAPAAPRALKPLLNIGVPLPTEFCAAESIPHDQKQQSLVLFIDPNCQSCRSLLPRVRSLSQRRSLPPLVGLAPGSPEQLQNFAQRENLDFPILPADATLFEKAAPQPPLLVLLESGYIKHVFPEGGLPTPSRVEEFIQHEK